LNSLDWIFEVKLAGYRPTAVFDAMYALNLGNGMPRLTSNGGERMSVLRMAGVGERIGRRLAMLD